MSVILPFGVGLLIGGGIVSNALRYLLRKHERPTLGILLGLLLGAVVGLWPFQQSVEPRIGETVIKGRLVTAENIDSFDRQDWPVARFAPSADQVAGSLALILLGGCTTLLIARIGRQADTVSAPADPASA